MIPYTLASVRSSKLYERTRWCVSAASTEQPSALQASAFTLTPSQLYRIVPWIDWKQIYVM